MQIIKFNEMKQDDFKKVYQVVSTFSTDIKVWIILKRKFNVSKKRRTLILPLSLSSDENYTTKERRHER